MLLVLHNLPNNIKLAGVKQLIKDNCGLTEVILDNFVNEGPVKRVTIGLADEGDAALLVRKMNGLFYGGQQLFVEDVRHKKLSDQPFRPNVPGPIVLEPSQTPKVPQFENVASIQVPHMMAASAYNNMPFYMTQVSNPYVNYDKIAPVVNPQLQPFYQQEFSMGYRQSPENQNRWIEQAVISYPHKTVTRSDNNPTIKQQNNQKDRRESPKEERETNWRERRNSPPRHEEPKRRIRTRRNKPNRNFEPDLKRRDSRRTPSRERDRYSRNSASQYDELHQRNRSNKSERSPPHDRRFNPRSNYENRFNDRGRGTDIRDRALIKRDLDFNSQERNLREQNYDNRERDRDSRERDRGSRERDYENRKRDYDGRKHDFDHGEYAFHGNKKGHGFDESENREIYNRESPQRFDLDNREVYSSQPPQGFDEPNNTDTCQNREERGFEINKHYSDYVGANPLTYSNSPNNSTFTNANINAFVQKPNFQSDCGPSFHGNVDFSGPPSKLPRISNETPGFNYPTTSPNTDISNKKPLPSFLKTKLKRHSNWLKTSSAKLSRDVVNRGKKGWIPNYSEVTKNVQKCIESRLDVIMQDKLANSFQELIAAYRSKFNVENDLHLYHAVIEKMERDKEESGGLNPGDNSVSEDGLQDDVVVPPGVATKTGAIPKNKTGFPKPNNNIFITGPKKNQPMASNAIQKIASQSTPAPKVIEGGKTVPQNTAVSTANQTNKFKIPRKRANPVKNNAPGPQTNRLPQFPQGNKQNYKDQKKIGKLEFKKKLYELDPIMRAALDHELRKVCYEYILALYEPGSDPDDEPFRIRAKRDTIPKFRKVLKTLLTKRLLNKTQNLVIRIFAHPKNPKRDSLDKFLKKMGAISVKKSDSKRMYMATVPNYQVYDEMLALQNVALEDGITLQLRPLHLTGPPEKPNKKGKKTQNEEEDEEELVSDNELECMLETDCVDFEEILKDGDGANDSSLNVGDSKINVDDFSTTDIDDPNTEFNMDTGMSTTNDENKDDSDVVVLENNDEVVVIEDNEKIETTNNDNDANENAVTAVTQANVDTETTVTQVGENIEMNLTAADEETETDLTQSVENTETQIDAVAPCRATPPENQEINEAMIDNIDVEEDDLEDF